MKSKFFIRISIFVALIIFPIGLFYNSPLFKFLPDEMIPIPSVTAELAGQLKFSHYLGSHLNGPLAVAVDHQGYIYLADSGNNMIKVYRSNGNLIKIFGASANDELTFTYPNAIAVDKQGLIYVGEFKKGRIQVFDLKANIIQVIDEELTELPLAPLALAVDQAGGLYVANHTGEVFVLDKEGQLSRRFGQPGMELGQFSYPNGIAVDGDQRIIVSDSGNARIQVFDEEGNFLLGVLSTQLGVALPRGIAASLDNRFYVVDIFGHQVVELNDKLERLFSFGNLGQQGGDLKFPNGITVDKSGNVFVAERGNNRISVFSR